jgi:hypothetical protein
MTRYLQFTAHERPHRPILLNSLYRPNPGDAAPEYLAEQARKILYAPAACPCHAAIPTIYPYFYTIWLL